ncbi:MAG: peptide chain release factor-like protein [Candidatus Omnitrophota bacterium]|jgi:protein subunit release factor B|nr:MAG: peptide chain release factor-like protein [Candidatus Omnitrophota bacterium]
MFFKKEMEYLKIRPEDVEERFVRSRGPGGQNVNKTSTCVWLRHIPTGTEVRCQRERSQSLNRMIAWEVLIKKIKQRFRAQEMRQLAERTKEKKARWRRPERLRLLLVESKRRHSKKKRSRGKLLEIE